MNGLTDWAWREIRELTSTAGRRRAIHCREHADFRDRSIAQTGRGDLARALAFYDPHLIVHLSVATTEEIARVVSHR
jgi:hypothetical protein